MTAPNSVSTGLSIRSVAAWSSILAQYLADLAILLSAMLVAAQMRLQLAFGEKLGLEYAAFPVALLPLFAFVLAGAYLMRFGIARLASQRSNQPRTIAGYRVISLLIALFASILACRVVLSQLSGLQLGYFAAACYALTLMGVAWPARLRAQGEMGSLRRQLRQLRDQHDLLGLWLLYNIRSRYSQTILGILWIILLPLSTALVLALAFTQLLRAQVGSAPFVSFFLSALLPWGLFNHSVITSTRAVMGMMGLINQIYFPREILVLLVAGEALVDWLFVLGATLLVNALSGIWPNALFVYLPLLLVIQIGMAVGLMLIVSCLSVIIRDIPQLVTVAMQVLFYLTPILYPLESIPPEYRVLMLLNPMTPIVLAYRQIMVYGQAPDLLSLAYPTVLAAALLYLGYVFFKANEHRLADLK